MSVSFFEQPILNSPYEYPAQHWELDSSGQPTNRVMGKRRRAEFITPIPKPKKRKKQTQAEIVFNEAIAISTDEQQYEKTAAVVNQVRGEVDRWRAITDPSQRKVSPETTRLLQHWRTYSFGSIRPFFCQVEAAETAIWLTEVAPSAGAAGRSILEALQAANDASNPGLSRLALKLATGAGKTTVMAMLIAWQTVNAVRHPGSKRFTRGFLIVTPGLTIRDRLRVLQPNDPDSYYKKLELVPNDMLGDMDRAKIVITNYHAFKLRETVELSATGRAFLRGNGPPLETQESEGQMLQRVIPGLMGMKGIMVLNDEAHHCYRVKPPSPDDVEDDLKGDDREEAEKNSKAARLWLSGLATVNSKLGVNRIMDLSATPFFLRGSGYAEGTLFPWTMSDFSLMDAIECGIVKLPRVPIADNIPEADVPIFRELWTHIGKQLPRKGRAKATNLDPLNLPTPLLTALEALYGHYVKTFELWAERGIGVPPCFIVVCQNTAISKLVFDYISGFDRTNADDSVTPVPGRLELFRNTDEYGNAYSRPRTLLIDSEQLESGDALDANFRDIAGPEIDQFRRDIIERTGDRQAADSLKDNDLLREVMNTVGKKGRLGESIRCVVSVSMLTEGWDTNTVTHVLGVRAFGTQLLCEQVIGRALRRQSYDLNEQNKFNVEYADILGIPFDFTAKRSWQEHADEGAQRRTCTRYRRDDARRRTISAKKSANGTQGRRGDDLSGTLDRSASERDGNVLLAVEPGNGPFVSWREMRDHATKALAEVGRSDIDPAILAGELGLAGQQFVEIARSVALGCRVLVLDEPTGSLTRRDIENLFSMWRRIRSKELGIVYISPLSRRGSCYRRSLTVLRDWSSVRTCQTTYA